MLDPELQWRRDRHRRRASAPSPEPLLPLDPEDAYMLYEPTMVTRGVFEHERKREPLDHGQWKPYSQLSPSASLSTPSPPLKRQPKRRLKRSRDNAGDDNDAPRRWPARACDTCSRCGLKGHWANDCPEILCGNCHQPGHRAADCPKSAPCFACGQLGHWVANCPTRGAVKPAAATITGEPSPAPPVSTPLEQPALEWPGANVPTDQLQPGTHVRVWGLKRDRHYNGRFGTVRSYNEERQQYRLTILDRFESEWNRLRRESGMSKEEFAPQMRGCVVDILVHEWDVRVGPAVEIESLWQPRSGRVP